MSNTQDEPKSSEQLNLLAEVSEEQRQQDPTSQSNIPKEGEDSDSDGPPKDSSNCARFSPLEHCRILCAVMRAQVHLGQSEDKFTMDTYCKFYCYCEAYFTKKTLHKIPTIKSVRRILQKYIAGKDCLGMTHNGGRKRTAAYYLSAAEKCRRYRQQKKEKAMAQVVEMSMEQEDVKASK